MRSDTTDSTNRNATLTTVAADAQPDVVILMRLLIDVVEQQQGRVRRSALRHDDDVVHLGQHVQQAMTRTKASVGTEQRQRDVDEALQRVGAVDLCRVQEILRHAGQAGEKNSM